MMKGSLNKGITLIALIITIIVLLILAGIVLAMVVGDNGILAKAQTAKESTNNSQDEELNRLGTYENKIDDVLGSRGEIKPTLVWTNPSPNSNFAAQTISVDLSKYKYAIVVVKNWPAGDEDRTAGILKINSSIASSISASQTELMREFLATPTGVQISTAHSASSASQSDRVIPLLIYGVESDLELDI